MSLQLSTVEKKIGQFQLFPLDLQVERGEFFCLLGPSGCGKTTVLRLIAGLESVDAGQIKLNGVELTHLPPHKRNLHTVFQSYALFPHLNVFENVAFSLRLRKLPSKKITEEVDQCLRTVEIEELKSRRVQQLSGGQAQRVALARALVNRPDLLLLDEPLAALDPGLRIRMRIELKRLCKTLGITFLMVTHDQEEALQLSDRLAVFRAGRCLQVGTPKAIYEYPSSSFVAKFLGPVNEIEGKIYERGNQWTLSSPLGEFPLLKNRQAFSPHSKLLLRPEKIRLVHEFTGNSPLLEGRVSNISYLGSRTEYHLQIGTHTFQVHELERERSAKHPLNPQDRVFLTWHVEDAIVLPAEAHEDLLPTA